MADFQNMGMEMTVADTINSALLLVTAVGVLGAFWQIRVGARAQRATFLKDLYLQLRSDSAVADAFYMIEYSEFEYGPEFHGSDLERKIDRLLTLIDLVCEMQSQHIMTRREMSFFEYQFSRVARDVNVQKYLTFLNDFYVNNGLTKKPFAAFQTYIAATTVPCTSQNSIARS